MMFDVIEFLDSSGKIMVGRVPPDSYGEFITGSQLIVHENQICVFYYDGKITDQFRAGRYTLSTQNLPIIAGLSKLIFKGKTPFRAFVYFVNLKTFIDMTWGTPQPILFRDTIFNMVHLRAFGTFAIRIKDHILFLNTIVGTQGLQETDAIQNYLRKIIISRFTNTVPSVLTTVAELASQYQNIEVRVKQTIKEDFAQYGLELVDMIVENINVPPDVQKRIDNAAGLKAFSDNEVDKYQKITAADALKSAADTGGAPEITAGLGLGAGIAMGSQFVKNISGGQATPSEQQPPKTTGPSCPKCHNAVKEDFIICPICKYKLKRPCVNENCKQMLESSWDVCPYCGTDQPA